MGYPTRGACDTERLIQRATGLKLQARGHIRECEDAMDRYRQEQQVLVLLMEASRELFQRPM
jgi:hypothetical protein